MSYTVLLVEDEQLVREELAQTTDWAALGTQLAGTSADGLDGEAKIRLLDPDIVITDIRLPGQDGLTVLKNWRNRGRNEPVLVLTAQGDVDQRMVVRMSGGRRRPLSAIAPGNKRPFCAFFPFGLVECVPVRGNG